MSVYRRKGSRFLWIQWQGADGKDHQVSSGTEDETEARALLAEVLRQERTNPGTASALTVEDFFEKTWLPLRRTTAPSAWKTDASRLRFHFLPSFKGRALADLATDAGEVEILDWLVGLRNHTSERDGSKLATRTVWNIASIVRVFFADALERKLIRRDPCVLWRADKHLPAKEDKVKGWRQRAGFTLDQVVTLTTDARIPEERRVLYALRFLGGGQRPSSDANVRWRDLDRTRRPLWRLTISSGFDSANGIEKGTKTGAEYLIPVHPVLQRLLTAWWDEGWERYMGRPPKPEDFIVPRQDGAQRRVWSALDAFYVDLETVGIPRQRQYESRSTFRNLCLMNRASEFHVNLITHPKPKQASDFYTRIEMQWPEMCAAVLCIAPAAWGPKELPAEGLQSGATANGTGQEKSPLPGRLGAGHMVTPTGLEPMSSA